MTNGPVYAAPAERSLDLHGGTRRLITLARLEDRFVHYAELRRSTPAPTRLPVAA